MQCEIVLPKQSLIKVLKRTISDLMIERAEMLKRDAPMAAINALDARIENAEEILEGVSE